MTVPQFSNPIGAICATEKLSGGRLVSMLLWKGSDPRAKAKFTDYKRYGRNIVFSKTVLTRAIDVY